MVFFAYFLMIVKETECKTILSNSSLADYCINPYTGCSHACAYCYARFMKKYTNHKEQWGKFVDVKINSTEVLERQLRSAKKGSVFLSSVTDAYQPLEKKYELTRKILERLLKYQYPVIIQTKSSLVLRDLDLIKKFKNIEVGFTISVDEKARQVFEPGASSIKERIDAARELKRAGIKTYAFFGPMLPLISDNVLNYFDIFSELDYVYVDKLNIKCGNWVSIKITLEKNYPDMVASWGKILFEKTEYYPELKRKIISICKEKNLKCTFCY
jgi:DNA repair photolyase